MPKFAAPKPCTSRAKGMVQYGTTLVALASECSVVTPHHMATGTTAIHLPVMRLKWSEKVDRMCSRTAPAMA